MRFINSLGLLVVGGAIGCGAPGQDAEGLLQDDPVSQGIISENGLRAINGLSAVNGLVATNGLRTTNGLATTNGLRTTNGLATTNGLMTNTEGRQTVKYIAKCALVAGDSFSKQDDNGNWHSFTGGLGIGVAWKDDACDSRCQQQISACVLAHLNSSGNHVPIFVTGDPNDMPSVGFAQAYEVGSDAHIQEGVYMGNIFASNPPVALYAKGQGFKASIPGRLGASSSNPYKPLTGYRSDQGTLYTGLAERLCRQDPTGDGDHYDYEACNVYSQPYGGGELTMYRYTMTTYVNANYDNAVVQDNVTRTLTFDGETPRKVADNPSELWTTSHNFEFGNSLNVATTGNLNIEQ